MGRPHFRYLWYFLYIAVFRHTPDRHRPYALIFPALRAALVRRFADACGRDIVVKSNADVSPHIAIGNRSELGRDCLIYGGVTLGDDVLMGPGVKIFSRNHRYLAVDVPIAAQGEDFKPVRVGSDVWIGANVLIMPGVTIHDHAVIAGGAVVTKDVPEFAVVGGNPARVLKWRGQSNA